MSAHEELLLIYRRMLRIRAFETRVGELETAGELRERVPLSIGREATAVGACTALAEGDVVISTHRPHGGLLARDVPMSRLMAELLGRAAGINRGRSGSRHAAAAEQGVFNGQSLAGAGIPLAAGAGLAAKRDGSGRIALVYFDASAVSTGAFHEGLTLAGTLSLPVLFFCENALNPEGSPAEAMTGHEDLAGRAESYGVPTISVDGNDVLAVYAAAQEAARRARAGGGATLIEARIHRWSAPPAAGPEEPRAPGEAAESVERDPIGRFVVYLAAHGVADEPELARIAREVDAELTEAVEFARSSPPPPAEEAVMDVYA